MAEKKPIDYEDVLSAFSNTLDQTPDATDDELLEWFPEFDNDKVKLQAAFDYRNTKKANKYNAEELKGKFPEFFAVTNPVTPTVADTTAVAPVQTDYVPQFRITGYAGEQTDPADTVPTQQVDTITEKETQATPSPIKPSEQTNPADLLNANKNLPTKTFEQVDEMTKLRDAETEKFEKQWVDSGDAELLDEIYQSAKEKAKEVTSNELNARSSAAAFTGASPALLMAAQSGNKEQDPAKVAAEFNAALDEKYGNITEVATDEQLQKETGLNANAYQKYKAFVDGKIRQYFTDVNMPSSDIDYFVRKFIQGNIAAQIGRLATESVEQRNYDAMGLDKYAKANGGKAMLDAGAGMLNVLTDPLMYIMPVFGGAAGEAVINLAGRRLASAGVQNAAQVAQRLAVQRGVLRTVSGIVRGGTTMAGLNTVQSIVGQAYSKGEVNFGEVTGSALEGFGLGVVFQGVHALGDVAKRAVTNAYGANAGVVAGMGANFAGGTSVLVGSSVMNNVLNGMDINDVNWAQEFGTAAMMQLMFDIQGNLGKSWSDLKVDTDAMKFTADEIRQFNKSGVDGKDGYQIIKNLFEGSHSMSNDDMYRIVVENPEIDTLTKKKLAYTLGTRDRNLDAVMPIHMADEFGYWRNDDGTYCVRTIDNTGMSYETRTFKSKEDARKFAREKYNECLKNRLEYNQSIIMTKKYCEGVAEITDEIVAQIKNNHPGYTDDEIRHIMTSDVNELNKIQRTIRKQMEDYLLDETMNISGEEAISNDKEDICNWWGIDREELDKILNTDPASLNKHDKTIYVEYVDALDKRLSKDAERNNTNSKSPEQQQASEVDNEASADDGMIYPVRVLGQGDKEFRIKSGAHVENGIIVPNSPDAIITLMYDDPTGRRYLQKRASEIILANMPISANQVKAGIATEAAANEVIEEEANPVVYFERDGRQLPFKQDADGMWQLVDENGDPVMDEEPLSQEVLNSIGYKRVETPVVDETTAEPVEEVDPVVQATDAFVEKHGDNAGHKLDLTIAAVGKDIEAAKKKLETAQKKYNELPEAYTPEMEKAETKAKADVDNAQAKVDELQGILDKYNGIKQEIAKRNAPADAMQASIAGVEEEAAARDAYNKASQDVAEEQAKAMDEAIKQENEEWEQRGKDALTASFQSAEAADARRANEIDGMQTFAEMQADENGKYVTNKLADVAPKEVDPEIINRYNRVMELVNKGYDKLTNDELGELQVLMSQYPDFYDANDKGEFESPEAKYYPNVEAINIALSNEVDRRMRESEEKQNATTQSLREAVKESMEKKGNERVDKFIEEGRKFTFSYGEGNKRKVYIAEKGTEQQVITKADFDYAKEHGGKMLSDAEAKDREDNAEQARLREWFWDRYSKSTSIEQAKSVTKQKSDKDKLARYEQLIKDSSARMRRLGDGTYDGKTSINSVKSLDSFLLSVPESERANAKSILEGESIYLDKLKMKRHEFIEKGVESNSFEYGTGLKHKDAEYEYYAHSKQGFYFEISKAEFEYASYLGGVIVAKGDAAQNFAEMQDAHMRNGEQPAEHYSEEQLEEIKSKSNNSADKESRGWEISKLNDEIRKETLKLSSELDAKEKAIIEGKIDAYKWRVSVRKAETFIERRWSEFSPLSSKERNSYLEELTSGMTNLQKAKYKSELNRKYDRADSYNESGTVAEYMEHFAKLSVSSQGENTYSRVRTPEGTNKKEYYISDRISYRVSKYGYDYFNFLVERFKSEKKDSPRTQTEDAPKDAATRHKIITSLSLIEKRIDDADLLTLNDDAAVVFGNEIKDATVNNPDFLKLDAATQKEITDIVGKLQDKTKNLLNESIEEWKDLAYNYYEFHDYYETGNEDQHVYNSVEWANLEKEIYKKDFDKEKDRKFFEEIGEIKNITEEQFNRAKNAFMDYSHEQQKIAIEREAENKKSEEKRVEDEKNGIFPYTENVDGIVKSQDLPKVESKRKFNINDYTSPSDGLCPMLLGVYRGNGYKVATDSHILTAIKTNYPKSEEGKTIVEKDKKAKDHTGKVEKYTAGQVIEGRYPNWERVVPNIDELPKSIIDAKDFKNFIASAREISKETWKKYREDTADRKPETFDDFISVTDVAIRFADGRIGVYRLPSIEKFADALDAIGAKEVCYQLVTNDVPKIVAKNDNGASLIMPLNVADVNEYLWDGGDLHDHRSAWDIDGVHRRFVYDLKKNGEPTPTGTDEPNRMNTRISELAKQGAAKRGRKSTTPVDESQKDVTDIKEAEEKAIENPVAEVLENKEKIEDFGEKIGMARKDTAKSGFTRGDADGRPTWRKKYKIMSVDDIEAAKLAGVSYFDKVSTFRLSLHSDSAVNQKFQEEPNTKFVAFYEEEHKGAFGNFAYYHFIVDNNGQPVVMDDLNQLETVIPVFEVKDQKYRIKENKEGKYVIYRLASNGKAVEYAEFDTKEDATAYLLSPEGCTSLLNRKRNNFELPQLEKLTRNGMKDHRGGKNVTTEKFLNDFGFRGGEFGNWVNDDERQQFLNIAYDSLMDLADVIGVSPRALSLNGELSIAFGARGRKHAAAHFESAYNVINMTKMNGAGSLAHEWAHALDNYFALLGKQMERKHGSSEQDFFATSEIESYNWMKGMRPEVKEVISEIVKAMKSKRVEKSIEVEKEQNSYDNLLSIFNKRWKHEGKTAKGETFMSGYYGTLQRGKDRYEYNRKTRKREVVHYALTEDQLAEMETLIPQLLTDPTFSYGYSIEDGKNVAKGKVAERILEITKDVIPNSRKTDHAFEDLFYDAKLVRQQAERLEKAKSGKTETRVVDTDLMEACKKADADRAGAYYSQTIEMFARSFEQYISNKMHQQGKSSDYLAYDKYSVFNSTYGFAPYPAGEEYTRLETLFDKLFDTIQEKVDEDTGKTVLYAKGNRQGVRKYEGRELTESEQLTVDMLRMLRGEDANYDWEIVSNEDADKMAGKSIQKVAMSQGGTKVYGWFDSNGMHIAERGMNPNTLIHEAAHPWIQSIRRHSPELYDSAYKLFMGGSELEKEVREDPDYKGLNDDEIFEEVFARYGGIEGSKKLEDFAQEKINEARSEGKSIKDVLGIRKFFESAKRMFDKIWNWIGENLFGIKRFGSRKEVLDRFLYDMMNHTDLETGEVGGSDMSKGAKRKSYIDSNYIEAVKRGDVETAEKKVREAAELSMPNTKVVDKDGNLIVMYHNTDSEEFNVFDKDKIGTGQGQAFLGQGFNFSRGGSGIYGKNEVRAYLDIKHPMTSDKVTISRSELRDIITELDGMSPEKIENSWGSMNDCLKALMDYASGDLDLYATIGMEYYGSPKDVIEVFKKRGFDGTIEYDNEGRIRNAVVFDSNQIKKADTVTRDDEGNIIPLSERFNMNKDDIRFSRENKNQEIFVSNAARAVERIKQDKATPAQWKAMITKEGGIKAGEDKWMGLSEWLDSSTAKTLTKDEVMNFIRENAIQIEDVAYSENDKSRDDMLQEYEDEYKGYIQEYREVIPDAEDDEAEDAAWERMIDHYGDDFGLAFYHDRQYLEVNEDMFGNPYDATHYFLGGAKGINPTRLQFTTQGLDNKREIALTVPTIESWNEGDNIHFGDAGEGRAIGWIRFGETTILTSAAHDYIKNRKNGAERPENMRERVLVIDEIQSKRHQEGRENGYKSALVKRNIDFNNFYDEMMRKYNGVSFKDWSEEDKRKYEELKKGRVSSYEVSNSIPDAPFDKNWMELCFKRMLRLAAEEGYDRVAWTSGIQQAKRYDLSKYISEIRVSPSKTKGYVYLYELDKDGNYIEQDGVEWKVNELNDRYGKEIGEQVREKYNSLPSYEEANDIYQNYQEQIRKKKRGEQDFNEDRYNEYKRKYKEIYESYVPVNEDSGARGMVSFYDQMLPSFVRKYTKKWGAVVEDVELPNLEESGRVMHSVNITPEMVKDVMEGQTMFSRESGETTWQEQLDDSLNGLSIRDQLMDAIIGGAVKENAESFKLKDQAVRKIDARLSDLRKAMQLQKMSDRDAVNTMTTMAKIFLKNGWFDNASRNELRDIINSIGGAVGKEDLHDQANKMMLALSEAHANHVRDVFNKIRKVKATKFGVSGQTEQGKIDVDAQYRMSAFNDAVDNELSVNAISERVMEAVDAYDKATDDTQKSMYLNQVNGYLAARHYAESVRKLKEEASQLKQELKNAKEKDYSNMEHPRLARWQAIREIEDAIIANRLELAEAYRGVAYDVASSIATGKINADAFNQKQIDRMNMLRHFANSDLNIVGKKVGDDGETTDYGRDVTREETFLQRRVNSPAVAGGLFSPLQSLNSMLKALAPSAPNGQGYLWDHFIRGYVDASEAEWQGTKAMFKELDDKVSEVVGKETTWSDFAEKMNSKPATDITILDHSGKKNIELTQGQLAYLYAMEKQNDGRMKLRAMGITEEDMAEKTKQLDPQVRELMDWIQDEYLVRARNKYNKVHIDLFGAPMAANDNYFPIRINSNARGETVRVEDNTEGIGNLNGTTTGAIIERRRNALPIDIMNADAFSVLVDHIMEMEHWAAFSELNRDANMLLSYNGFKNKLGHMTTMYGAGDELKKNLKDAFRLAVGSYVPNEGKADAFKANVAKGISTAKITFRVWTAAKQLLSHPAFLTEIAEGDGKFMKYYGQALAHPFDTYKWAKENLPLFDKRISSRTAGDTRLMDNPDDWKLWHNKVVEWCSKMGMAPNAFVDALTCAQGAKGVYESRKAGYLERGLSEDVAEKRALQDATIAYNETQQSSEGAFISAVQKDRTIAAIGASLFNNANMAYMRRLYEHIRQLKNSVEDKSTQIAFLEKKYKRMGMDDDTAKKSAETDYKKSNARNAIGVVLFGYLMQVVWRLADSYLIVGDDKEKKNDIVKDAFTGGAFSMPLRGTIIGKGLESAMDGRGWYNVIASPLPVEEDMKTVYAKYNSGKNVELITDMFNMGFATFTGVNPETLTNMIVAVSDACEGDLDTSHEFMMLLMRVMSVPESQVKQYYIDELGSTAEEIQRSASKGEVSVLAKRYADYRMKKSAPVLGSFRDEIKKQQQKKQEMLKFKNDVKDRVKLDKGIE